MRLQFLAIQAFALGTAALLVEGSKSRKYAPLSTCSAIDYDVCVVCVVGAGGSGAYTAVRLKEEGFQVLVLEKTDRVKLRVLA